jgi:hypothetical protein
MAAKLAATRSGYKANWMFTLAGECRMYPREAPADESTREYYQIIDRISRGERP